VVYTLIFLRLAVNQPRISPTWAAGTGALPTLVPLLTAGDPLSCV